MIEEAKVLLKTSRPVGWIFAPLIFLIGLKTAGTGLTYTAGLQIILLSFPFCLLGYGINDVYDYGSDKLNPRKGGIQGIKLESKYHSLVKRAIVVMTTLLILSALLTLNITNIVAMLILLFLAYAYSAPPLRLKEKPPLDSIANGIGYLFLPFLLGFSFGASVLTIPITAYLVTVCGMAFHAFTTIMDYDSDKKAGDKTFAIVFGKRTTALVSFLVFTSIVIFSSINMVLKTYFSFCSLLFLFTLIFPSEKKLTSIFLKLLIGGFCVTGIALVIVL